MITEPRRNESTEEKTYSTTQLPMKIIRSAFANVICPEFFGSPICIHCQDYDVCETMIQRQRARAAVEKSRDE